MDRYITVCILAVCCVLASWGAGPGSLAADTLLQDMSNSREDDRNRISFSLDRIPAYEIDISGQRVVLRLKNTRPSTGFRELPRNRMLDPLTAVRVRPLERDSVIAFFFRNVPVSTDVSVEEGPARLHLDVFWERTSLGIRPGIADERIGRLRPVATGAYAQRGISSEYEGRWIDFFEEFEWPPDIISLPFAFSLPPHPDPLARQFASVLSGDLLDYGRKRMCRLLARLPDGDPADGDPADDGAGAWAEDFPGNAAVLMSVGCLLHEGETEKAISALDGYRDRTREESAHAAEDAFPVWETYFRSWAFAVSGKHHQAAERLASREEASRGSGDLAHWYRLLQSEIDLALGKASQARIRLEAAAHTEGHIERIYNLRTGDAFYAEGAWEKALARYAEEAADLEFMGRHPVSLANYAGALYRSGDFAAAHRYFSFFSAITAGDFPGKSALGAYWSAMALYHSGEHDRAVLRFWAIGDEKSGTDAAFRARMKLLDLDILGPANLSLEALVEGYGEIAEKGPDRQVREEAFFKKILAYHLEGESLLAVRGLGRFFNDFRAGPLQGEGAALLVALMPGVIHEMVEMEAFFPALALVGKHRTLLAQASIPYGFLYRLAESYEQSGFLDNAARTYLYILDFEKKKEKHEAVFLPLIRIYSQKERYRQVLEYASIYLADYENGNDRADVYYHYADALYQTGDLERAVRVLHEQDRPESAGLDELAGTVFYDLQQRDRAEQYYSRALRGADNEVDKGQINLRRAEMFFADNRLEEARPVYESLLDEPRFRGQAGYRLINLLLHWGEERAALNIYEALTEMDIEDYWMRLARETAQTGNAITGR